MSEGGMRPSVVNIKQKMQGVYGVDPLENWKTAVGYCTAVPLTNNGIYYHCVAELRAPKENVKHNRSMGVDHVLDPSRTRVVAFRFYVVHCREWRAGDGHFIRQAWDPYLEYRPKGAVNSLPERSNQDATAIDVLHKAKEYMKTLTVPVSTGVEGEESQFVIEKEYEAVRENMGSIDINGELVEEMQSKLFANPNGAWKHCHHACTFLYLRTSFAGKWNPNRVKAAIWQQTKAARFGHDMNPDEVGFSSSQVFRPLPSIWINEPFGLNLFAVHDVKLRAKKEEDSLSAKQWKKRTRMTQSSDPLNYWIDNHRREVLPPDGMQLRSRPTMICYFASPRASLKTAGVFRDDTDKNLTEAYLRTTVSHFVHEMDEQTTSHSSVAGAVCFGARIIRTSSSTGYAFYRDPNQYIFNLAWINCSELSSSDAEPSRMEKMVLEKFYDLAVKRLTIVLLAAHEVSHLIVDTAMLVGAADRSCDEVAVIIRDAIYAADFRCDHLTIIWPRNQQKEKVEGTLPVMWGDEDDEEPDLPVEDMEVDYEADNDELDSGAMKVDLKVETYEWREDLRRIGFSDVEIDQFSMLPTRRVSSLRTLPLWSADSESPHPFVAAQKAIIAMGTFNRKAFASEAYWVGSEDTVKLFPNILLACLRRQETYIKKFMYKDKSTKDRVMN